MTDSMWFAQAPGRSALCRRGVDAPVLLACWRSLMLSRANRLIAALAQVIVVEVAEPSQRSRGNGWGNEVLENAPFVDACWRGI
jgi:hypothetical protein